MNLGIWKCSQRKGGDYDWLQTIACVAFDRRSPDIQKQSEILCELLFTQYSTYKKTYAQMYLQPTLHTQDFLCHYTTIQNSPNPIHGPKPQLNLYLITMAGTVGYSKFMLNLVFFLLSSKNNLPQPQLPLVRPW